VKKLISMKKFLLFSAGFILILSGGCGLFSDQHLPPPNKDRDITDYQPQSSDYTEDEAVGNMTNVLMMELTFLGADGKNLDMGAPETEIEARLLQSVMSQLIKARFVNKLSRESIGSLQSELKRNIWTLSLLNNNDEVLWNKSLPLRGIEVKETEKEEIEEAIEDVEEEVIEMIEAESLPADNAVEEETAI